MIEDFTSDGDPLIGSEIGAYRLEREIGRGGMGAVYFAVRVDGSFRQNVAVKLIKRGMDTDYIVRRFKQERQILAALDHPYIAALLGGGTTPNNLPYFVMEYVGGESLYEYCDRRRLTIIERLKVYAKICEAVNFAHRHRVVHRDLKPSNILIKPTGAPKLLDFGIAKVLSPELGIGTLVPTQTAMRMLTPEYAAPEQLTGGEITPAADVYSLGVMLYELLTGHRPYRFENRSAHEFARITNSEVPLPSLRIDDAEDFVLTGGNAGSAERICQTRRTEPHELRLALAGDLERVILKALAKESGERYENAGEMLADLENHMANKPVSAPVIVRPIAKATAPGTGAALKSIAVLPLQYIGTADQSDEYLSIGLADAMITRLSKIRQFVVRPTSAVLRFAGDTDAFSAGRHLQVDYVLGGTIRRSGARLRISAQLFDIRSAATLWAERFDEDATDVLELEDIVAEKTARLIAPQLTGEEQEKLARRGTDSPQAFEAYLRGRRHLYQLTPGEFGQAKDYFEAAVRFDPDYALAYAGLAEYHFARGTFAASASHQAYTDAQAMARRAIEIDDTLSEAYAILGYTQIIHFDFKQVEKLLRRSIALNPNYALARVFLSVLLNFLGEHDEAVKQAKRAAELNPLSAFEQQHYAWILYHARRFDEALDKARRTVAEEPDFGYALGVGAWIMRGCGDAAESIGLAARAAELSGGNPWLSNFAASCAKAGETAKAYEILRNLEASADEQYISPYGLALAYNHLGETERAVHLLEEAFRIKDGWFLWLATEPQFDGLRNDPRCQKLLELAKTSVF